MKRESIVLIGLLAMALQGSVAAQQGLPVEVVHYADLIVTNGVIYSADEPQFSRYEAMAVRDGKILALGTTEHISRMAGPNTRRIELQPGQSVLPGLFDSHAHGPMGTGGGLERSLDAKRGNLTFATIEEGLREIAELIRGVPAGEWVVLVGPRDSVPLEIVTRWQLDTVSPNNPVIIETDSENGVVNSKAWEAAGLTSDVPGALKVEDLIALGIIRTDNLPDALKNIEQGEGTGQLRTWAYGAATYAIPWSPINDDDLASLKKSLFEINAQGITTLIGRTMGRATTILHQLWERNELTARARLSLGFLRSNPRGEEYLKRIGKLVNYGLGDMVKIIGLTTQHADGTMGSGGMLTFQRKLRQLEGDPYSIYGENRWEVEGNDSINVELAIRYGWNVSGNHNQGDQATWLYLKAIEAGHAGEVLAPTSLPHGNDHNNLVTQESLELMRRYNVVPSVGLYLGEERLIFQYGADTAHRTSAFRTMIDTGLRPSSEEARPALRAIEKMITRTDDEGRVWGQDQKLSRREALWARTLWSAGYVGEDDRLGSLEVGKLADFVLLGRDFLQVPVDEISQIPVLMTILGGKVVYDRERDGVPVESRRGQSE